MVDVASAAKEAASVGKASAAQIPAMAGVLARAFHDDPVFTWVLRGDPRRMRVLQRGFELFLRRVWIDEDETFTTVNVAGVAVWEPPGAWKHGVGQQLRLLPSMLAVFGRHIPRWRRSKRDTPPSRAPSPTTTCRSSASIRPGRAAGSAARRSRRCWGAATATAPRPSSRPRRRATACYTNATDSR